MVLAVVALLVAVLAMWLDRKDLGEAIADPGFRYPIFGYIYAGMVFLTRWVNALGLSAGAAWLAGLGFHISN
jgi:hypothetical protein